MKIVHLVRSDSFAGVERHIALVAPRLVEHGCEVTVVGGAEDMMRPALGGLPWMPAATTAEAVRSLRAHGRVQIVHAHMTAAELAAVLGKPSHRAKLVSTLHFAARRGSSLPGGLVRPLSALFDAQVAVSRFIAEHTTATHTIYGGVERSDAGRLEREKVVAVVQRLEPEKQTELALRAWAASSLRSQGWRLRLAGRGSQREELRVLTESLGITDSVDWLGFVGDVNSLLANAGALLATAPGEPFGLTVAEAMARATPVIAAGSGGHIETMGPDGWFFEAGDAEGCAQVLDRLIVSNPASYGQALQGRQRDLFDIDHHVIGLVELYESLLPTR